MWPALPFQPLPPWTPSLLFTEDFAVVCFLDPRGGALSFCLCRFSSGLSYVAASDMSVMTSIIDAVVLTVVC